MNWDVLASSSDSSEDEKDAIEVGESVTKTFRERQATTTFADAVEDTVVRHESDALDEMYVNPSTSQGSFRQKKKQKEKKMRRRLRNLHDSFVEFKTPIQHEDVDYTSKSTPSSCSNSISSKIKSLSHNYRADLSINCVFLLAPDLFDKVALCKLCDDHHGAFRNWADQVLRESTFGDIVDLINQHCASFSYPTKGECKSKKNQSSVQTSPFEKWVQNEKNQHAHKLLALEQDFVVFHPKKERISVSNNVATIPLLDNVLKNSLAFSRKSDCNKCCACSNRLLKKKRRFKNSTDAFTSTSFEFLGAYLCYRMMYIMRSTLEGLCNQNLHLTSAVRLSNDQRFRSKRKSKKKCCTAVISEKQHQHAVTHSLMLNHGTSNTDGDRNNEHSSTDFFINADGDVVIVTPNSQKQYVADQKRNENENTRSNTSKTDQIQTKPKSVQQVDMWGCAFAEIGKPPSTQTPVKRTAAIAVRCTHTCSICLEILCHPCSLRRCGHVFCRGCLLSMLYSAAKAEEFNEIPPFCALCREDFRACDVISDVVLDAKLRTAYPDAYAVREPECEVLENRLRLELFGTSHEATAAWTDDILYDANLVNSTDYPEQQAIPAACPTRVMSQNEEQKPNTEPNDEIGAVLAESNTQKVSETASETRPLSRVELRAARLRYYCKQKCQHSN